MSNIYSGGKNWKKKYKKKRYKKGRKAKTTAALAKQNRSKINSLINSEITFKDTTYATGVSSSGAFLQVGLQGITQGDGEGNRSGDKITIKTMSFKLVLSVLNGTVTNGDAFNNLRIMLIRIPQPNTNSPLLVTDILQNQNWNSHYRKSGDVKWKKLFDKTYYMDNQGFGSGAASNPIWTPVTGHQKTCKVNITFPKGLDVTYEPGTSIVYQNDLRLFVLSDSAVPGHPTLNGYLRMKFLP